MGNQIRKDWIVFDKIITSRRAFVTGLVALVAAPAIVRAGSLMPVKNMLILPEPPVLLKPSRYYKLVGRRPVGVDDFFEWARIFEDYASRNVAQEVVDYHSRISTVFLGLDHNFGSGPPLLFESLIFGGPLGDEQRRYSTYDEAERGHAELVALARKAGAK
jgi:hypothetical protein